MITVNFENQNGLTPMASFGGTIQASPTVSQQQLPNATQYYFPPQQQVGGVQSLPVLSTIQPNYVQR
ncbi:unnamed protein product [Thelazia callipaeda]|uniref:RNA-binding (RRM/RBD/RNP motifs) family protein n=1 Tax=Thelazia callipaeda TaxID=103827 RepID=A0A0N5D485_THECL|nr:unnamed protein product [Thelazia callipaeda]